MTAFVSPESVPYPTIGKMALLGLIAVHIVEVFAFTKRLVEKGGSAAVHAAQLLVFGFLHVLSTERGT